MKTFVPKRRLHVLGLLIALLVFGGANTQAQQMLEVPATQGQPPVHYRPRLTPRFTPGPWNQTETLPSVATPAPPQAETAPTPQAYQPQPYQPAPYQPPPLPPARQAQPVLPAVFRGCWEGTVSRLDRIDRLPGGARIGPWTPKTYRLCYRRLGDGPFELTFTDAGIADNRKIINSEGRMRLVSTDGHTYATMSAFLHFDEYRTHMSYFGSSTFPVDETTRLQCDIEPDGMHVWGSVYGQHDGSPWFRAWWHTLFIHVPS